MSMSSLNSISALNALTTKQQVAANNVANVNSKQFKKSTALLEENASGGVTARTQAVNTPGVMINHPDGSQEELSNVDLEQEMVDMIANKHAYQANLKALKTDQDMEQSTIDLVG